MILETVVQRQGNSRVIILPKSLGLNLREKVKVLILRKETVTVKEMAGLFQRPLKPLDVDRLREKVKAELWGEEGAVL